MILLIPHTYKLFNVSFQTHLILGSWDQLGWHYIKDGYYSVRLGYCFGMPYAPQNQNNKVLNEDAHADVLAQQIWKLKIPYRSLDTSCARSETTF